MEKEGIKIYTKTKENLEQEFEVNKGINKTSSGGENLPENMIEYVEKLIIENIRSINNQKNANFFNRSDQK